MDLMPHITALLDDLITMTNKITVKRSDLASLYENDTETVALYNQYVEILNGDTTFFTYYKYPKDILRKYTKWSNTTYSSDFGALVPLIDSNEYEKHIQNNRSVIFSKSSPSNDISGMRDAGDIWVKYTGKDQYYAVSTYKTSEVDIGYKLYETNDDGERQEIPVAKMESNDIFSVQNRELYIYDQIRKKYIPVKIQFEKDYQEYDPDNFSIDPSWEYYNYNKDEDKIDTLFVKRTNANGGSDYILYKDNLYKNIEDETKYYLRYKLYIGYSDEYYYSSRVYKQIDAILDSKRYVKYNNMQYYKMEISDGIYNYYPLYSKNEVGDYYYDSETEEFKNSFKEIDKADIQNYLDKNISVYIYNDNVYIATDGTDNGPYYIVNEKANSNNRYEKVIDTDEIYYCYIDYDADKVSNVLLDAKDPTSWRYEINDTDDSLQLYYSFDENDNKSECTIEITSEVSDYEWSSILQMENDITYERDIDLDNIKKYYFYKTVDQLGSYSPYLDADNNIIYFEKSQNGSYNLSLKEVDDAIVTIYTNSSIEAYESECIFSEYEMNIYSSNRNKIPSVYRDTLKGLMEEYIINEYCPTKDNNEYAIPIYYGEKNNYYRQLNGIPPLNQNVGLPKINRTKINPEYNGTKKICYVFELTDNEVSIIEENGMLEQYKQTYPNALYLNYIGKNRLDVVTAREAAAYDILSLGNVSIPISKSLFMDNYKIARNYILNMQYHPELFGEHEYYHAYIGFTICVLAMILCISKSGDMLIRNEFMDQKTVDNIFRSFGFNGTFDKIPFIYRRNIAKNIYSLIRNKGIDAIYEKVIDIFNIDAEVYKYYFRKIVSDNDKKLSLSQVPINDENIIKHIIDSSNAIDYDDITKSDRYWGVYQSKESIKTDLLNSNFNYMDSKYIALNNKFSLTELNFNSAYLLNYLLDATKFNNNNSIKLDVDHIEKSQLLQTLIVTLFAINAIRFNFDGNIPNDIISAAAIYKFNLDTEIVNEETGKINKIIDLYLDYMTHDGLTSLNEVKTDIDNMVIATTGSIKSPIYNNKNDNNITDIIESYTKNTNKDDILTEKNENSIYNKLLNLRDNAKTIKDFRCFDELLTCISICKETSKAYKFDTPIWEPMYSVKYRKDESSIKEVEDSEKINYIDVRTSWNILSTSDKETILNKLNKTKYYKLIYDPNADTRYIEVDEYEKDPSKYNIESKKEYFRYFLNPTLNDESEEEIRYSVSLENPGLNQYLDSKYVICIHDLTREELMTKTIDELIQKIDVYEKINILPNNYTTYIDNVLSGNNSLGVSNVDNKNSIYIGNDKLKTFIEKEYTTTNGSLYIEVVKSENSSEEITCDMTIYRKCDFALSYIMYLREESPEIYQYLQQTQSETRSDYIERMNEFSSAIIASIEDGIESDELKHKFNLSYIDFSNISNYIKLLINIFKSYTIDLSAMDTIYTIDDKNKNRIKMVESYFTDEQYSLNSNFHINDMLSSEELYHKNDFIKIKDQIYIEYYARQLIDIDNNSTEIYYRICNNLFSDKDYRITAYAYSNGINDVFYSREYINKIIGKEII